MPSPSQIARLAALESRSPAIINPMHGKTAAEVRQAIQGLLTRIDGGYDETLSLHRWAWSAPDADMIQFSVGQKPDHADWWR